MDMINKKNLNAFSGWILVFLLMHTPIALYNVVGGLTLMGTFINHKTPIWFVLLSATLSFLLPATIILLLKRNAVFRWTYVAYTILMATNFFIVQGFTTMSISVVIFCTAPWIIYLFSSKRVYAILENKKIPEKTNFEE
ncbi:MAG: hypothetical protein EOM59_07485 [Clostridia bacterium]|nr:hypothetical protein [Clostridia bacterium]